MDIFIILMCLLFIILVIFQVPSSNGLNNLTSGEEGSIIVKKVSFMTKFMFSLGIFIFFLVFLFSYLDKKEKSETIQIEQSSVVLKKESNNE